MNLVQIKRWNRFILIMISVMLIFSLSAQVYAQQDNKSAAQLPIKLGSVNIRNGVTFEINNLILLPSDNGQLVGFTLTVNNNSNTELDFIDYWVDLQSKAGARFSINMATANVSKIAAKSTKDIVFYSNVGSEVKASDLKIRVIEWDFSYADFKKVIGEISVPANYNYVTKAETARLISLDETRISVGIERASIGKSEKYYRPDLKLVIKNEGKRSVTLPELEFVILTPDGLTYPLSVGQLTGTLLTPLSEKEVKATASIPNAVNRNNWKLAVINPIKEKNIRVPLAIFEIKEGEPGKSQDVGKYYTFSNTDGTYQIKLNGMNRLPMDDNDLLVAHLTIANDGEDSLPLPELVSKFKLNDNIEFDGVVNTNDRIISIAPGKTVDVQAVTSIPYTYDISEIDLMIQQPDSSSSNDRLDLVEFEFNGAFDPIPTVDGKLVIEDTGYRSNVSVRNLFSFEGNNANIVAAEIEVENLEKRQTTIQKFSGYFEQADGTIYPANFHTVEEKIFPNGKAIVYAYSTVPKSVQTNGMKLVVGKAVEQAAGEKTNLIGYVNPKQFILPAEKVAAKGLQELKIGPYTMSIKRVGTQARFDADQVSLEFDYELDRDLTEKSGLKEHAVVVELVDADGKASFTRKLKISDDKDAADSGTLAVGSHTIKLDPWNDQAFVLHVSFARDFHFNVYMEFESGYKAKIAEEKIPWFVNRTFD
jgi:hypothetical protein